MERDTNPFADEDVNPFASVERESKVPPAKGFGERIGPTFNIPLGNMDARKERELAKLEEELKRREKDIKQREDALTRAGAMNIEEKNWPPIFPIIHHDIANEIPLHAQKLQYLAFASWLGLILCLVWNIIAVLVCWVRGGGIMIFLLAIIYALSGCPLSYILWYRPLYRAMKTDSVLKFGGFFLFYMIHIGFCVLAAIAPPIVFKGESLTGILATIDAFSDSALVGVFYLIGFAFFSLESVLSVWVLQRVYAFFRGEQ